MSTDSEFIFSANLEEGISSKKKPYDSREKHLRRVNDILHLCLLRGDIRRARRAWCILASASPLGKTRKRYPNWMQIWDLGLQLIDESDCQQKVIYAQYMMFKKPEEKEVTLKETALSLILVGRFQEALNELDTYLPSSPYQENTTLHTYAGLCCLYLHQMGAEQTDILQGSQTIMDKRSLAMTYFDRALFLDPNNIVAATFAGQLQNEGLDTF